MVETCNSASTLTSSHWRVVRAARSYLVVAAWQSSLLPAQSNNQLPWPGAEELLCSQHNYTAVSTGLDTLSLFLAQH